MQKNRYDGCIYQTVEMRHFPFESLRQALHMSVMVVYHHAFLSALFLPTLMLVVRSLTYFVACYCSQYMTCNINVIHSILFFNGSYFENRKKRGKTQVLRNDFEISVNSAFFSPFLTILIFGKKVYLFHYFLKKF